MNVWNFTGHLGRDADKRYIPSGEAIVQFSVAVKSGFGEKAVTTWARCALWGKRGEAVAQYLIKGQLVGISGEVSLREYTGKDGVKQQSLEVRVADVTLLGQAGQRADRPTEAAAPPARTTGAMEGFDDDIPF